MNILQDRFYLSKASEHFNGITVLPELFTLNVTFFMANACFLICLFEKSEYISSHHLRSRNDLHKKITKISEVSRNVFGQYQNENKKFLKGY